jgi:prepilin-type N-terminal cleavage/methylation domain-containing protein
MTPSAPAPQPRPGRLRPTSRAAFTLLELLVVIAVILVLASLLSVLIGQAAFASRRLVTVERIQAVTTSIEQSTVHDVDGCLQLIMACQITSPPYPTSISPTNSMPALQSFPLPTGPTHGMWPANDTPTGVQHEHIYPTPPPMGTGGAQYFNDPWGRVRPDTALPNPAPHLLRNLCPYYTRELLMAATILDPPNTANPQRDGYHEYMTNRSAAQPWNDRWGNPLVVSYGLYEPLPTPPGSTTMNNASPWEIQNLNLQAHQSAYAQTRIMYLSVAAAGPHPRVSAAQLQSTDEGTWCPVTGRALAPAPAGDPPLLLALWAQACEVCEQAVPLTALPAGITPPASAAYDRDWSEQSFASPPWQGTTWGHMTPAAYAVDQNHLLAVPVPIPYAGQTEDCFLSAPVEIP